MKKLILLFAFVFLFSLVSIQAQPPFEQEFSFDKGYEIQIPGMFVFPQNENYTFHFHVINLSNGLPINETNSNTNCAFHLYNGSTGKHQYIAFVNETEHLFDYEFFINATNFTTLGLHSYLIQCFDLSAGLGGIENVEYLVTPSGTLVLEGEANILFLSVLVFLLIGCLFFIGFLRKELNLQIKWSMFLFSFIFFLISLTLVSTYVLSTSINQEIVNVFDIVLASTYIMFWFIGGLLIVIWILTLFQTALFRRKLKDSEKYVGF